MCCSILLSMLDLKAIIMFTQNKGNHNYQNTDLIWRKSAKTASWIFRLIKIKIIACIYSNYTQSFKPCYLFNCLLIINVFLLHSFKLFADNNSNCTRYGFCGVFSSEMNIRYAYIAICTIYMHRVINKLHVRYWLL
jgi:hypothetical protein